MISASWKTDLMPQLRLIYRQNLPLNFERAVSTLRCIKCFLMICMALSKKVFCLYFRIMANGLEGWLKDAEGQNLADAVLKTASSSLFVIQ